MWASPSRPPTPFLHAVELTGGDPARWVHVGDDIETDVQGAQAMGMRAVWINRTGADAACQASSRTQNCRRSTGCRRWWSGCYTGRTDRTGGRCAAAVYQLWPPSTEPNSSPEVAPK